MSGVKWLKKVFPHSSTFILLCRPPCVVGKEYADSNVDSSFAYSLIPDLQRCYVFDLASISAYFHSLFQVATEMVSIRRDNGKKKDKIIDLLERFNVELKQFDLKENDGQTAGNRRGSSAIESFLKLEGATKDLEIDFQEKIKRAKDDECLVVVSGIILFFWPDICLPCSPGMHCLHPEKD